MEEEGLISKLKKIGVKEIAQKTLITEKNIQAIVDKDFKSLQKTRAIGFIGIIEREFKLDLSEWIKEYQTYLNIHGVDEEKSFIMGNIEKENSGNKLINLFIYFVVFISIVGLFYILSDINSFNKKDEDVKEVKELVEEAKVNLNTTKEINNSNLNILAESNKSSSSEFLSTDENNSSLSEIIAQEQETIKSKESGLENSENFEGNLTQLYIEPKYKIWVGIVTLPDYKRNTFTSEGKFEIDTSKEQLIALGHKKVEIFLNGQKVEVDKKRDKFHYKDGVIKAITSSEFKELNRGKSW